MRSDIKLMVYLGIIMFLSSAKAVGRLHVVVCTENVFNRGRNKTLRDMEAMDLLPIE